MAGGDPLSGADHAALDETIRSAEQLSRVEFSVFIGAAFGSPRDQATSLHNSLVAPSRSVLIMVDPNQRVIEVVTGEYVRRTLTDQEVETVVRSMESSFADGELLGGLQTGIRALAVNAKAHD